LRETIASLDTAASGNPRFTYVTKDITSYKVTEKRLRRNEERFRTALRNSPVVVFCQDKELRHTWIYNPALGFKAEDVIGKRDIELCERRADADLTEALKRRVIETGVAVREEVTIHYSGVPLAYHLAINPLRNAVGEIEGITCTATDITERKQAQSALQKQQNILHTLIETAPSYIYMKDPEGRYLFVNSPAARAVGKTPQEIIGQDDTFLFPPSSARQIMEKERELMESGHSDVYEEIQPVGGEMRRLLSSKNVCRDSDGAVIGIVGISRDITELREAQDAVISSELNSAGERMAHALAHEINNPLAAITNSLYLLQHGTTAFPSDALLNSAQDALARITKITRQMIGLYNRNAPPGRMKVQEVLEDAIASMDSQIRSKGIRFEKRLDNCEFAGIETDVRQLVSALLENSVEQSSGLIKIRLFNLRSFAGRPMVGFRLLISDDGPGISPAVREQVFEPFFSTKPERGRGLGLWVARGIVEKYGGSIRLRSSIKEGASGTCVCVSLPSLASGRSAPDATSKANTRQGL